MVVAVLAALLTATGCWAQSPSTRAAAAAAAGFAPGMVRQLRDFGAVGDGQTDDTAAIRRAFTNSDQYCLDGGGRTYRVVGTLRVRKNFCLRNITLLQSAVPIDTRPYITASCPGIPAASSVVDCGDPVIPSGELGQLRSSLSVRTLLIRPEGEGQTIGVTLDHVKIDRGRYPAGGSRTDAAGIYLQGGDGVNLRNVEVTGAGKGYGLMVIRSRNVTVDNLWVHDLVWAPYPGDPPLSADRVEAIGWNVVPIHEFRAAGQAGVAAPKFYGVRVQEQIVCASFSEVQNVVIRNPRISHCMARFQGGDLPWQADGLDISRSSTNVTVDHPVIDSTWEGMDIVADGNGVDGLSIIDPQISNAFGFGLKLGYELRNARVTNPVVSNAGIAGIVIYGPVDGVTISGAQISGVGTVAANGRTFVPWRSEAHSGIAVQEGRTGAGNGLATPRDVLIDGVTVVRSPGGPAYDFAVSNKGGGVRVRGLRANGFSRAPAVGVSPSP